MSDLPAQMNGMASRGQSYEISFKAATDWRIFFGNSCCVRQQPKDPSPNLKTHPLPLPKREGRLKRPQGHGRKDTQPMNVPKDAPPMNMPKNVYPQ